MKNTSEPVNVSPGGELAERARLNFNRLHDPEFYSPEKVFRSADYSWPGDFEGRTILALTLLSSMLDEPSANLSEIMQMLPDKLNAAGYFGKIYEDGSIDEQQLASHGWVLRALSEYYLKFSDQTVKDIAVNIIRKLALPMTGKYKKYPVERKTSDNNGGPSGELSDRKAGDWLLSSDICCAFIFMDGIVQASEVFKMPECNPLIEEMILRFHDIDLIKIKAQTHASLTTARGALRYYSTEHYKPALELAVKVYNLYRSYGMTEHFANYNWFMRPEWTEPCAIIDSFILAVGLWRNTGNPEYLRDAHCIWHTGVERAQRPNGGFGGETCPHAGNRTVAVKFYEATWCCSMRGGEGLFQRIASSAFLDNATLTVAFPGTAMISFGENVQVTLESDYPYAADCKLKLLKLETPLEKVRFFVPPGVETVRIFLNETEFAADLSDSFLNVEHHFKEGDIIRTEMPLQIEKRPSLHSESGLYGLWFGPLMMGLTYDETPVPPFIHAGKGIHFDRDGRRLEPLNNFWKFTNLPDSNEGFAKDTEAFSRTAMYVIYNPKQD